MSPGGGGRAFNVDCTGSDDACADAASEACGGGYETLRYENNESPVPSLYRATFVVQCRPKRGTK
jgi:hypothetical protein